MAILTESEESYARVAKAIKALVLCEQTLHKGLIDASCDWIQYTRKIEVKIFFR